MDGNGPVAAQAGVEVDRLVIGVLRAAPSRHGTELRRTVASIDLAREWLPIVADLAEFLLADALTADVARARFRYTPDLEAALAGLVREGHLVADGDTLQASPAIRSLADDLIAGQGKTAGWLWAERLQTVAVANHHAGLAAAAAAPRFALAAAHAALPEPDYPCLCLLRRLTTLRYMRADAHAAAWAERGLAAAEADALTALWNTRDHLPDLEREAIEPLRRRGWVEGDPLVLTTLGRQERDAIEAATNSLCEPAFAAAAPASELLGALRLLPDHR